MINWDLWNQAGQKLQNETRDLYDFSWVTPELVKGFSRYQALRPEQEVKEAQAVEEAKKGIEDEIKRRRAQQWRTKWEADRAAEELQKDLNSGDMYDVQGLVDSAKEKGARKFTVPEGVRTRTGNFWKDTNVKVDPGLVETELLPPDDPGMTDEERAELETEILKERLGDNYDAYMRSYGIYGGLNPYEQMIQAGKRSSYWDPEIGKIYTDAGEKIRDDRIAAWKEAIEGESALQKQAMDMFKQTGYSRYRREAESRLDKITELLNNNPRKTGKWFEGYDTAPQTDPEAASSYDKIEKKLIDEGPIPTKDLEALIAKYKLKGEDVTDLLKQNDDLWEKRYGPQAAVTKRTEEAIRAQSDKFKTEQRERMDRMDQLENLRTQLNSTDAGEATYRMAAETLKKLDLDITKSFDEKTKREIENARKKMVNSPSFASIGAYLVLVGGQKLGLTPSDLNSLTSDDERKDLIKQAVETLYETDRAMYEVARQRMLKDIEGVPGINTSVLSWMNERKPMVPESNSQTTKTNKTTKKTPPAGGKKKKEPLADVKVPAGNNSPLLNELLKD